MMISSAGRFRYIQEKSLPDRDRDRGGLRKCFRGVETGRSAEKSACRIWFFSILIDLSFLYNKNI